MICPSIIIECVDILLKQSDIDVVNPFINNELPFGCGAEVSRVRVIRELYSLTRNCDQQFKGIYFSMPINILVNTKLSPHFMLI